MHVGVCGIGFGHASREAVIINALKQRGWSVSSSSYGDGLQYLRRMGIDARPVPGVRYGILPEAKVSIKLTIYHNLLLPIRVAEQIGCELNYVEGSNIVVSDTRASTIIAAKLLRKPVITILNQFNIRIEYPRYKRIIELLEGMAHMVGWIWARSDRILIADYPSPLTISKRNLAIPEEIMDKVEFIGPILEKSPTDLPSAEEIISKYGLEDGEKPIIFLHATGPRYEREKFVRKLIPMLADLRKHYRIIASLGGMSFLPEAPADIRIFEWVDEPLELFKIADLIICRGGQTTIAKALSCGKPLIMIPISAHGEQLGNALSVAERGAGLVLRQEDLDPIVLGSAIEEILSDRSYKLCAEEYARLSWALNPLDRVIKVIEEYSE